MKRKISFRLYQGQLNQNKYNVADISNLTLIFTRPKPLFQTFHTNPCPSKGFVSKMKNISKRDMFSLLDKKTSLFENMVGFRTDNCYFENVHICQKKLKNLSKRDIFSLLDIRTSYFENMKEIRHRKLLFPKFTYPFRVHSDIRQYGPWIIERTIGLVLGPSTALFRPFLERCTLTNKTDGTL